MRARPEQTQLEDLSDDSFLGKLLVLPANVRLDWKVFARHKHFLFGLVVSYKEKSSLIFTSRMSSPIDQDVKRRIIDILSDHVYIPVFRDHCYLDIFAS